MRGVRFPATKICDHSLVTNDKSLPGGVKFPNLADCIIIVVMSVTWTLILTMLRTYTRDCHQRVLDSLLATRRDLCNSLKATIGHHWICTMTDWIAEMTRKTPIVCLLKCDFVWGRMCYDGSGFSPIQFLADLGAVSPFLITRPLQTFQTTMGQPNHWYVVYSCCRRRLLRKLKAELSSEDRHERTWYGVWP